MPSTRVQRRLAAILAADIVAYSRLIETDEARTLTAIKALRSNITDPIFADHRGRVVKVMGDGLIVEFGSVVDAVACAIAMQQAVAAYQEESPPERRIVFRIGIALGDVVVEGEDLMGDGVNIAARLEALSEPGGICITDAVSSQLLGKIDDPFDDAGVQRLKNISQPVRVWRWAGSKERRASSTDPILPDRPSIAVLPFDNLSGQAEQIYFSDGVTEDIITGLARFRSLMVIARNSSFAFRGKPLDMAEIGRKLGVSYLLEGSLRRAGDRVRITAQLIEAATGVHLWAERYDRNLEDIFAVQEEVARTIVWTLVGRIEGARLQQSLRKPTSSLAAYDCVLRGLAHFRGYAAEDNQRAYEFFEQAVALDPHYAVAHAYRAIVWVALHGYASAPAKVLDTAFEIATHGASLDPTESGCQRALASIWLYRREYAIAEHHFRRAHELNPNDADKMVGLGAMLTSRGKAEEGLGWIERAMRLNPLYPAWYRLQFSITLYSLGRYTEAAEALRSRPNASYWSRARAAACYAQLGQAEDAAAETAEVLRLRPDFSTADFLRRDVLLERAEDREHLRQGLLAAGLPP